jgi:hypothetical protein
MDGGNAENAGAIFGHVLGHAGLFPAFSCGARLALRRKNKWSRSGGAEAVEQKQ